MIEASCDGTFMIKNENEVWELLDTLSENSMHHASVSHSDRVQKKSSVYESGHCNTLKIFNFYFAFNSCLDVWIYIDVYVYDSI